MVLREKFIGIIHRGSDAETHVRHRSMRGAELVDRPVVPHRDYQNDEGSQREPNGRDDSVGGHSPYEGGLRC